MNSGAFISLNLGHVAVGLPVLLFSAVAMCAVAFSFFRKNALFPVFLG